MSIVMNDVMHDLLNKIRIISKIREGQKLDTNNGLNVYTEGWLNWLARKWNRDTKDEGVRYLRDLYKSIQQTVENIINESKMQNHTSAPTRQPLAVYVLVNTATELKASVKGLDNLCKTYVHFPTTVAAIDGILKDYVIVTYSSIIDAIPEEKLTKELRESVSYGGNIIYKGIDGVPIMSIGDI